MFYDANLVLDSLQNTVLKTHLNFAALPRPRPLYVVPPFYASFLLLVTCYQAIFEVT